jgi:hypothetical protein
MHITFIFLVAAHAVAHGAGVVEALVSGWIDSSTEHRLLGGGRPPAKALSRPTSRPVRFSTTAVTTGWQLEFTHIRNSWVSFRHITIPLRKCNSSAATGKSVVLLEFQATNGP